MKKKRTDFKTKRNVDSGVWLGSDERDDSASSFIFGSDDSAAFFPGESHHHQEAKNKNGKDGNNGYYYGNANSNPTLPRPLPHATGTYPGGASFLQRPSSSGDTHIPTASVVAVDIAAAADEASSAVVGDSPRKQVTKINRVMESEAHTQARAQINRCLEEGDDNVDLS